MADYIVNKDGGIVPSGVPIQQPQPEMLEDEEQEQERPESKPGWGWVGAPDHPDAAKHDDGISDLLEVGDDLTDTQDLIAVDIERDILDAGPKGDLSDLVEVSEEDILGDEETGQIPLEYKADDEEIRPVEQPRYQRQPQPRQRRIVRYQPPTSMRGMQ